MAKKIVHRAGFTLIEVMVAVMIISVVILALIQMYANNTHIFSSMKQQSKINQYSSFLISNDNYGFKDKNIYLDALVEDFNLEDDLRRELKEIKIKMLYRELESIDLGDENYNEESSEENEASSNLVLEIGESLIQTETSSTALLRFRVK